MIVLFFLVLHLLSKNSAICDNIGFTSTNRDGDPNTLKLVHVIFRHGDRTNTKNSLYPKDPHRNVTYYPYGFGQLTKEGKKREFILGQLLRRRYGYFLGNVYTPQIIDARSSDFNRTKMSLELVLAGLFPPSGQQIWDNELPWQPIPYNYLPKELDKIFFGILCPTYKQALEEYRRSSEYQIDVIRKYQRLFQYLTEKTGKPVKNDMDVFRIYNGMSVEVENGLTLPRWVTPVYPEPLRTIAISTYYTETATTTLKQLGSGYLLRKIIEDSNKKAANPYSTSNTKMYLYSGHEFNLAFFLITLGVFEPQIPPYGAHILVELHYINGLSYLKLFYHDYTRSDSRPLKLPLCEEFCPLQRFIELMERYIPDNRDCGREEIVTT